MENYANITSKRHRVSLIVSRPLPTRQPEVDFLHSLGNGFANFFSKPSLRAKTLRTTNLLGSRYFKREKISLPVDLRRSKTSIVTFRSSSVLAFVLFLSQ